MGDYIRRLVSGSKVRYKDSELDIELDLAYITDQVIVMGYPASGLESLYRNRREDAKRYLDHRHGRNFWVFNFCPIKENSYPASLFDGRVSRYPFPDHQFSDALRYPSVPPLAVLPLSAREIRLWLDGSSERVAVLHCKAGKGRSGTMACAYILALNAALNPPSPERNLAKKERARNRAEQVMDAMPADQETRNVIGSTTQEGEDPIKFELNDEGLNDSVGDADLKDTMDSLSRVLDLHTSRRMKRPSSPSAKIKQVVSIPSQRRWLYYWSLILAQQTPPDFWSVDLTVLACSPPKVWLSQIRLTMRELGSVRANLLRVTNALLDSTGKKFDTQSQNSSQVWASLARYDDDFVGMLERWEKYTRHESRDMGFRKPHADAMNGHALANLFQDGRWDSQKMVQSFARMSALKDQDVRKERSEKGPGQNEKSQTGLLRHKDERTRTCSNADQGRAVCSEDVSLYAMAQTDGGIVLEAHRELRVKLYLGQVLMGWFWFIPVFHMQQPRGPHGAQQTTTFALKREELDFAVGVGANIIEVAITMSLCDRRMDAVNLSH